ncbi:unnamed protein product [Lampetra fluviatilis]
MAFTRSRGHLAKDPGDAEDPPGSDPPRDTQNRTTERAGWTQCPIRKNERRAESERCTTPRLLAQCIWLKHVDVK